MASETGSNTTFGTPDSAASLSYSVRNVIGDVVDMFVPSVNMSVYYGSKHIHSGCEIKPSIAIDPPKLSITGQQGDLFTLVMTDPDEPNPSEPSMRKWVHWIVVNIPEGGTPDAGKEVLPYIGPQPKVGIHRYILVLYKQKKTVNLVERPKHRANFNTRRFANLLNLGLPVATVFFHAQRRRAALRRS